MTDSAFIARLRHVIQEGGDIVAVISDGVSYTWSDVNAFATALADAMNAADPTGKCAALVLRNRPSGFAAMAGVMAAPRRAVPITPIQPTISLCAEVQAIKPSLLIADRQDWTESLDEAASAVGAAGIEIQDVDGSFQLSVRPGLEKARSGLADCAPEGAAIYVPTSGTTGAPKRVPMPMSRLDAQIRADSGPLRQRNGAIHVIPFVTIGGLGTFTSAVIRPTPLVLMERLDVRKWADLVEQYKPRRTGLPPAGLRMLLDADIPKEKFASVECWVTGSGPLDPDVQEGLEDRYGVPVLTRYGATELGGVAGWTVEMRREFGRLKRGSAGQAYPGVQIRIIDQATGQILPPGEQGLFEVNVPDALVRGPGGWTRSTDLGRVDADGFVFVEGRADDVIIRGGLKVPLFQLESAIAQHPAVHSCAAVDLPDARLGQVPAAVVVLNEGFALTEAELIAWLRERIAPFKLPVRVKFTDELPRTSMLKNSRPLLRAMFADEQQDQVASGA